MKKIGPYKNRRQRRWAEAHLRLPGSRLKAATLKDFAAHHTEWELTAKLEKEMSGGGWVERYRGEGRK